MAERQYTPGLLDRLRGRDPNDPNPPKAPSKPTIDQARRTMMKERQDRLGAKTGDGNIYKNGAGTQQSAQRMGMPVSPTKSGPVIGGRGGGGAIGRMPLSPTKSGPVAGGRGGGGAIGRMPLSPTKSGPVAGGRGGGGAAGRMTTQKAAPAVATRKPAPKPMSAMAKLRADKDFMSTIEKDAAALRKPAQKAAPKAAASKKSSGLSANKSYADYKKLMEYM